MLFYLKVITIPNNLFKHAIATVVPTRNVVWNDLEEGGDQQEFLQEDFDPVENF